MKKMFPVIVCTLAAAGLLCFFTSTDPLPIVQKRGHDGQCVRVIVVLDGRETARPCSAIDLDRGRYDTEYVYGTAQEEADFQKEMAEQAVLQHVAHR